MEWKLSHDTMSTHLFLWHGWRTHVTLKVHRWRWCPIKLKITHFRLHFLMNDWAGWD